MSTARGGTALVLALAALIVASAWVAVVRVAEAHAVLVRSSPAAGAQLETGPSAIDLWFSEPLEPAFSTFELLDVAGTPVRVDGIAVDPDDPYHLSGLLRLVGPGLYTVAYRNVSVSDGHEWSGSYSFTVLNPDGAVPAGTPFEPSLGASNSPANVLGRWITFAGFTLAAGGATSLVLVARRRAETRALWPLLGDVQRRLALVALPLLVAGSMLVILAQAQAIRGASVLDVLTGTRGGTLWLWRALAVEGVAVVLALAFLARRWRRPRGEALALALLPAAAAAGLLTITLLSHAAAAPGSTWSLAVDYVHLLLAACWLGGVVTLALVLLALRRGRIEDRATAMVYLVAPFSVFAAVAVYLMAVTGVVRSIGELPSWPVLWETAYGRWLLVKLVLVAGVLGVAFLSRRAVRGVARGASQTAVQAAAARLSRLLPYEVAVGVLILGSVAVLGQTPTPRGSETPEGQAHAAFNGIAAAGDDLAMHLQVTPAVVGANTLRIHVYRQDGGEPQGIERVRITFARAGALGGQQIDATPEGGGIFSAQGEFLSLALSWNLTVDVSRAGEDDARAEFEVPIARGSGGAGERSPLGSPAPQLSSQSFMALLLLMAGAGLALLAGRGRRSALLQVAGWVAVLVALWLGTTGGEASLSNPTPGDQDAIARGASLYQQHCAACHGEDGRGDGVAAAGMVPPPADMRTHIPQHAEIQTFMFITQGIPGTSMPSWEGTLSEDERWDLVNFLSDRFGPPLR